MPVNQQTRALIDMLMRQSEKPMYEMTIEEFREGSKAFDALGCVSQPVERVDNQNIPGQNGEIPIRIYTPKGDAPFPALIYFKGSGFINGELDGQDALCRALTNSTQCKVIAVHYRSAPEHKYPIGLNDSYDATKWVVDHAAELSIDPAKIAISGYSSGGNYAALVAIRLRDEGVKLAYQVLMAPVLDLSCSMPSHKEMGEGYILDAKSIEWTFNLYLPKNSDRKDPRISPMWEKHLKGLPPTLMITAEYDPLIDEGKEYAQNLKAAGVPVKYTCYIGQVHALLSCRGELDQEENPVDEIGAVLSEAFE